MANRRAVITGLGVIASNGIGVQEFWQAQSQGRSGTARITSFDTTGFYSQVAGEIKGFDPLQYIPADLAKRVDRFVHFGLAATKMALEDSHLDLKQEDRNRVGVIIGSGLGGNIFHEEQMLVAYEKGAHRLTPLAVPRITPNAVSGHIAIQYGCMGPNMVISTACASGSYGIGESLRKIQYGDMDIGITGGVEATLSRFSFGGYDALRVLSKRNDAPEQASRPFDKNRDGFVLSEGGAMLVLEELEHALARKAPIYGEITGYANNSGAHHMVMPDPDGKDAARAMAGAIKDAGLSAQDIDHINAHGTSTLANDRAETKAIREVFGKRAYDVPVTATKSMIGHSIGAAGAIEAVVCALVLKHQFIPPTINYQDKDPDCDLDYVPNKGREAKVNTILSNSFGFGNCNACLVFSRLN